MNLPITTLYAAPLAVLFLTLWMLTTKARGQANLSIGHDDGSELHEWVRRHGNFTEWVPMVLILMALAELNGLGAVWLHVAGLLLLAGRLLHPFGLKAGKAVTLGRIAGNTGPFLAVVTLLAGLGVLSFASLGGLL